MGRSELRAPEGSSVSAMLASWSAQLAMTGVPSPMHDSRALAAHVLDVRPGELILLSRFDPDDVRRIEELVRRRATREPLQYITGSVGFLGLDLMVGPGVFVPRPETELMADHVVEYLQVGGGDHLFADRGENLLADRGDDLLAGGNDHLLSEHRNPPVESGASQGHVGVVPRRAKAGEPTQSLLDRRRQTLVVDLCTGSGALGLAIAANVAAVACVGVEDSPTAAQYAQRNALNHADELAARGSSFEVLEADAVSAAGAGLTHLRGTVDVVVCNPPYIPDDSLPREPEVRDYDPPEALYGGVDGLDVVRQLVDTAAQLLRPGGLLALEHADSQGEGAGAAGVPGLLRNLLLGVAEESRPESMFQQVVDHLDLNDRPRFTTATRHVTRTGVS